jgi:hypothetical protein
MLLILARIDASSEAAWHRLNVCCGEAQISALSPQSVVIESLVESVG